MTLPTVSVIDETVDFLVKLANIPSPTGDAEKALTFVKNAFGQMPVQAEWTRKGALVLTWPGDVSYPRALTAHVDTLGAMVREIKGNGRLKMTGIGGFAWSSIEGEGCTVMTAEGKAYRGTVLPVKASVHIFGGEAREMERKAENYEVRLDASTSSEEDTRLLGIDVGDFIYIDPRVELNNGFIRTRHLDDKAGVAAIYGAFLALQRAQMAPRYRVSVLISNYEEVGHGGAAGIPADVEELVAVDMAAVGDGQASDEFSVGICAKDSGGPYHLGLRRYLEKLARDNGIPYRIDTYPFYGSDGEAAWHAGADLKVALIGPGVDASHAYERTHRASLEATTQLLMAYLLSEKL